MIAPDKCKITPGQTLTLSQIAALDGSKNVNAATFTNVKLTDAPRNNYNAFQLPPQYGKTGSAVYNVPQAWRAFTYYINNWNKERKNNFTNEPGGVSKLTGFNTQEALENCSTLQLIDNFNNSFAFPEALKQAKPGSKLTIESVKVVQTYHALANPDLQIIDGVVGTQTAQLVWPSPSTGYPKLEINKVVKKYAPPFDFKDQIDMNYFSTSNVYKLSNNEAAIDQQIGSATPFIKRIIDIVTEAGASGLTQGEINNRLNTKDTATAAAAVNTLVDKKVFTKTSGTQGKYKYLPILYGVTSFVVEAQKVQDVYTLKKKVEFPEELQKLMTEYAETTGFSPSTENVDPLSPIGFEAGFWEIYDPSKHPLDKIFFKTDDGQDITPYTFLVGYKDANGNIIKAVKWGEAQEGTFYNLDYESIKTNGKITTFRSDEIRRKVQTSKTYQTLVKSLQYK